MPSGDWRSLEGEELVKQRRQDWERREDRVIKKGSFKFTEVKTFTNAPSLTCGCPSLAWKIDYYS